MRKKSATQPVVSTITRSAMPKPKSPNPSHEDIARLAYTYWKARDGQGGSPEEDWYRAEQEIQLRTKTSASSESNAE
jgi:hypothetical protein